jgi:hypothetical protein
MLGLRPCGMDGGVPDSALPALTIRRSAWCGQKSGESRRHRGEVSRCRLPRRRRIDRALDLAQGDRSAAARAPCLPIATAVAGGGTADAPWAQPVGADREACTRTQPFPAATSTPMRGARGSVQLSSACASAAGDGGLAMRSRRIGLLTRRYASLVYLPLHALCARARACIIRTRERRGGLSALARGRQCGTVFALPRL